jgi:hypothetical protein
MAQPAPSVDTGEAPRGDVVARASMEYRVKRYLMVALLVGWGVWSLYDGYVRYPTENEQALRNTPGLEKKPHTTTDIMLNRWIGYVLPPVGLALLAFAQYNSRGRYELRGQVLNVPGHPPVPLDAIRAIDKTDWDRKGIAYLDYELANGTKGRLRLDDFIYERQPTDDIFKRIEDYTGTGDEAPPARAAEA